MAAGGCEGSLKGAAAAMGMSYRKAQGHLCKAELTLEEAYRRHVGPLLQTDSRSPRREGRGDDESET